MILPEKYQSTSFFNSASLREIFLVSDMTLWRWRKTGFLDSPNKINGRNYWTRQAVIDLGGRLEGTIDKPESAA